MRERVGLLLLACYLCFISPALAAYVVDTGPGRDCQCGYTLYPDQWLAAKFTTEKDYVITDLLGWMGVDPVGQAGALTIKLYGDGGEVPDVESLFFSASTSLSISSSNWYGISGQEFLLKAGTYWIAFEVLPGSTLRVTMPYDAPYPLQPASHANPFVYRPTKYLYLGIRIIGYEPLNALSCTGFAPPMESYPVKVKKNRVFPIKAQLLNSVGSTITPQDITAPPVIQVMYKPSSIASALDVTDQTFSPGQATPGNQFLYADGQWQFNLQTKSYTAPGTYEISILSGNDSEYQIPSPCKASFVIE